MALNWTDVVYTKDNEFSFEKHLIKSHKNVINRKKFTRTFFFNFLFPIHACMQIEFITYDLFLPFSHVWRYRLRSNKIEFRNVGIHEMIFIRFTNMPLIIFPRSLFLYFDNYLIKWDIKENYILLHYRLSARPERIVKASTKKFQTS